MTVVNGLFTRPSNVTSLFHSRSTTCELEPRAPFQVQLPRLLQDSIMCPLNASGMVCDSTIKVPATYLGATIQQRHRRERPSLRTLEVGDAGERELVYSLRLQSEYQPPKVCIYMLQDADE